MDLQGMLLVAMAGALGGLCAKRIRLPGGSFLGALVAAGAVSLGLSKAQPLPGAVRSVALLLLGVYTGSTTDRQSLARLGAVLPWHMCAVLVLMLTSIGLGWLLHTQGPGNVDLVTAALSTMPGGASGLTAMAYDLGADARLVASLHSVRQVAVFGLLPLVLQWSLRGKGDRHHAYDPLEESKQQNGSA